MMNFFNLTLSEKHCLFIEERRKCHLFGEAEELGWTLDSGVRQLCLLFKIPYPVCCASSSKQHCAALSLLCDTTRKLHSGRRGRKSGLSLGAKLSVIILTHPSYRIPCALISWCSVLKRQRCDWQLISNSNTCYIWPVLWVF